MGTVDFNDLAVFTIVVETASFSAAAARLRLPKSSVSRAIARLEDGAGVRLLNRTTRRVVPSTAGKALYDKVHTDIASLRTAVGDLPDLKDAPSGRIRVTSVVDMAGFFAKVVAQFVARHPSMEVDLRLTNDNVDLISEGIDVALRFSTVRFKDSSLSARKLCSNDIELFASPTYLTRKGVPRTPDDLDRHEWVVYRRKTDLLLENGRQKTSVTTRGRITCDDFTFLRAALVNGCGIGYLGAYQAEEDITAGRLVRVLPDWTSPISSLWALWPGPRELSRRAGAFLDSVLDTLRTHPFSFHDIASRR
jgi:DNA-binding transcriptional LysR family regulator